MDRATGGPKKSSSPLTEHQPVARIDQRHQKGESTQ